MLDRKEEGDPPTKFRPPRINFEPKSGSERGRERKVCENKGAKGFRGNIRKLEKRFRENFEKRCFFFMEMAEFHVSRIIIRDILGLDKRY